VPVQHRAQGLQARHAGHAGKRFPQDPGFQQVELVGLVHGCLELARRQPGGQVYQRKNRSSDGDPQMGRDLEVPTPVHNDAGSAPFRWCRHLNRCTREPDSEQSGCTRMAECRSLPTAQHRRHPFAVLRQAGPTHRVDAGRHGTQSTTRDAVVDCLFRETEIDQLRPCDNSMLPAHELPNPSLVDLPRYKGEKRPTK